MINLLLGKAPQLEYRPTIGLNFGHKMIKSMLGEHELNLWDFGGQKAYIKMYLKDYLKGSDLVFVVTDSTPINILTSRELIDFALQNVDENCPIIAIANKQDLCEHDGRMNSDRVEGVLHIKTYGLTAINPLERAKLIKIIEKELNQVLIRRRLKEIEI